jgi:hypothetical protein
MALWYSDDIIDLIFIFPYFFLLVVNIFNCVRHGVTRQAGYLLLIIVCIRRALDIVGNN